ncbi:EscU/YscU/HrcU family type III secretion system export apparatus switch protein [Demequina sp. TTPB684]|uniref:EscU/YscU/HrcU family type III secretion system export apparatus switch protein n=1 Tax=unclassified Demequina TaxID=2620311 RepID=UPI001CF39F0B|nr:MULTISPECIES: EscU/YscU/HrcU family type III secretion system export apparatus switch protein [unclassified Demequina]MCB2412896.1 EscU/YscU/HrcU family type III secretion system export apparatus switch protein [Demequina sp. TTPB684]UPU87879.1 EscU/YscU/HrcU family type III secretion system export apparatus switch protein [Demequina sp. TMPB413]
MSNDAGGDKTEKATPKRIKELRRDGSLQRSQDLSAWVGIAAAAAVLPLVLNKVSEEARTQMATIATVAQSPDPVLAQQALWDGMVSMFMTMAPLLLAVFLAAILSGAVQGGIHFAPKKLKPSFKHFNPKQGAKKIFGGQAWWNGAKAALKAGAIGAVLYIVIQSLVPLLLGSGAHSLTSIIDTAVGGTNDLVRTGIVAGLVLAGADMLVVMKRNRKQTRMSMKEIKDENKNTEGDPLLKGAIRSRQLQMSRNRMMAEVAHADVVLVNPTHVAVALKYEPGTGAPRVVAKGKGHVATRIRQVASDKKIPMVQDIALARALHAACKLGDEIPAELYTSVARVLAFVLALRRRGAAVGMHRNPHATPVAA